jgi:hypothetical protein
LEFLWQCSKKIVDDSQQIPVEEPRRQIAERCFRRIMLMTLTFLRLNPLSSFFPENGHWDLPSCAAIARCILETYLRMFHFGVEQLSEAESVYRVLLMKYHAAFQGLEIHTESRMPEELLKDYRESLEKARRTLENDKFFQNLPEKWCKNIMENPSRMDLPKASGRAGISPGFYHSTYEFCSSFVHGSLYAMELTEKVNLQTGNGRVFFARLSDLLCGYVALAVRDFQELFPQIRLGYPRLTFLCQVWTILVQWENIPGFDQTRVIAHNLDSQDKPDRPGSQL